MELREVRQPPFNNSLMGVIRGAADYHGMDLSTPMLYGASGHAFLMNVHDQLCPSGPYVWNRQPFYRLLRNLGLDVGELGFIHGGSSVQEREALESRVKVCLDEGIPCGCCNMDNQIIIGYNSEGFDLTMPWSEDPGTTPSRLTFSSWKEFGAEVHADFFEIRAAIPGETKAAVQASLEYAVHLYRNPGKHTEKPYGLGPNAYSNWVKAVKDGHGTGHEAWWNAMVWAECRRNASKYLVELADGFALYANDLAETYSSIAGKLEKAADREIPADEKVSILESAADEEAKAVDEIAALMESLD